MGARELRTAFNEVAAPAATCITALLEYDRRHSDTESQILYFSGNYADGTGFAIKSDRVRPGDDVNDMARITAQCLLKDRSGG